MKRHHEEDILEEEPSSSKPKLEEEEINILQDIQTNLRKSDLNNQIEKRLFETQKEYFTVYMEKIMKQMDFGEVLVNIVTKNSGKNKFEYTFTAAKTIIQSKMRVKQIRAFHAIFDMFSGLIWRYIHEKVVSPALSNVMSTDQLNLAYEKYQCCSKAEEETGVMELQCISYCIQEMLENEESIKIPNPLYSRLNHQMKAMSDYIIALLVFMSKPDLEKLNTKHCSTPEEFIQPESKPNPIQSDFKQSKLIKPNPIKLDFVESIESDFRQSSPIESNFRQSSPIESNFRQSSPIESNFRQSSPIESNFRQSSPIESNFRQYSPIESNFRQYSPIESNFRQSSPRESDFRQSSPTESDFRQSSPTESDFRQFSPIESNFRQFSPIESNFSQSSPIKSEGK